MLLEPKTRRGFKLLTAYPQSRMTQDQGPNPTSPKYYIATTQNTVETLVPGISALTFIFKPVNLEVAIASMDTCTWSRDLGKLPSLCVLLTTDKGQFSISVVRSCPGSPCMWFGNCYFPLIQAPCRSTTANACSANPPVRELCLQKSPSCPNVIPK